MRLGDNKIDERADCDNSLPQNGLKFLQRPRPHYCILRCGFYDAYCTTTTTTTTTIMVWYAMVPN
ncbi:hypothetical protein GQX74_012652 [Glossina fuscipes]|nr:hypothetical protein GQX74_012652 [Glossina fuscipes]